MTDVCNWHEEYDDGTWQTDCRGDFTIIEGTPEENRMKFCCYCGKPLVGHPYVEEYDPDEDDRIEDRDCSYWERHSGAAKRSLGC